MPTEASSWLRFAHDDLAAARTLLADPDLPSRIACFHAQQSAEKALKALLIASSIPFKKTHDLVVLAGLQNTDVGEELESIDLLLLHPWAVEARYPGDLPDASDEEAALVVATAATVCAIATRLFDSSGPS
jgi:HEPN domain-containing protein